MPEDPIYPYFPHSVTTIGAQQNLQHHNTPAGVRCHNNKIVPSNNPEVIDDDTDGTSSLSVHASYLWFEGQNDLHTLSEGGGNKVLPGEPAVEEDEIYWQASIEVQKYPPP